MESSYNSNSPALISSRAAFDSCCDFRLVFYFELPLVLGDFDLFELRPGDPSFELVGDLVLFDLSLSRRFMTAGTTRKS